MQQNITANNNGLSVQQRLASPEKHRFWELDFLRGLCVILMMIDHFFYSAHILLPNAVWPFSQHEFWQGLNRLADLYWHNYAKSIAHYAVVSLFLLICGISCTLSHSNFLRSLKAMGVAALITVVTHFFGKMVQTNITIWFGVIHMYGVAIFLYSVLASLLSLLKLIQKKERVKNNKVFYNILEYSRILIPGLIGLIMLIVFFGKGWGFFELREGPEFTRYFVLESGLTVEGSEGYKNLISAFIQLKNHTLVSADYFPLVPYMCVILIGTLIGGLIYNNNKVKNWSKPLDGKWNKPVCFVGRHAILFYILHQIVIIAFFFLVGGVYYLFA